MLLRALLRHGLPLLTAAVSVLADDSEPPADLSAAPEAEGDDKPVVDVVEKLAARIVDQDDAA